MTLRYRLVVLSLLTLIALVLYGLGRFYSPSLVTYVVEQTLIEKAPPGTDPALLRRRFEVTVSSSSNEVKLQRLLRLSQYLEKVQELTPAELDLLLREAPDGSSTGTFKNPGNFFLVDNV